MIESCSHFTKKSNNDLVYVCLLFSSVQGLDKEPQNGDDVILEIPQGILAGEWRSSLEGKLYAAFESIPYAKPPVGKRRFANPQKAKKWHGVWMAKKLPNTCMQWISNSLTEENVLGQEDCLYLNVYSPNPVQTANLPVIVYIHGGAFLLGSGIEQSPTFLMDKNVVFVTINYRLGTLGFLATEDDEIPGNLGLKDQVMALRWVKDNIINLGGNPMSVTIAGSSAGGASVHLHMLSPMSKGLFHKAISMSGTSFCPWAIQDKPLEKALAVGASLGCTVTSTKDMVACMRHRPAHLVVGSIGNLMPWIHAPVAPVAPVVELYETKNPFLTQNPYSIVKKGDFNQVPWITSITAHEGLYPAALYLLKPKYLDEIEKRWIELAPLIFDYSGTIPSTEHYEVALKIKKQYFEDEKLTENSFDKFVSALSDRIFVRDAVKAAKLHASVSRQPVYFYYFNYKGTNSLGNLLGETDKDLGVCHCDDLYYVTEASYLNTTTTDADRKMITFMTNMWVNFAKSGDPGVINWKPVEPNSAEINYLEIKDFETSSMKSAANLGLENFWESLGFSENENWKQLGELPRDEL